MLEFEENILHPESRDEKCRERNREHAKQTRLRKKNMIDSMKARLVELQDESLKLERLRDESDTANILLCLGVPEKDASNQHATNEVESFKGDLVDHLKHSVRQEAASKRKEYFDEACFVKLTRTDSDTNEFSDGSDFGQDDKFKRERNRMHAKLTRNRKKLLTAKMQQAIDQLEMHNKSIHQKLCFSQPHLFQRVGSFFQRRFDSPREVWTTESI